MTFDQPGFDIRCEWGENGVRHLVPSVDVVVISECAPTLVDNAYINQPI